MLRLWLHIPRIQGCMGGDTGREIDVRERTPQPPKIVTLQQSRKEELSQAICHANFPEYARFFYVEEAQYSAWLLA